MINTRILAIASKQASPRESTGTVLSIALNTNRQYKKVETKVPRVTWLTLSCTKLRGMRGPNWLEASDSTTITIENTTPAVPIITLAIVERVALAPSGSVLNKFKVATQVCTPWWVSNLVSVQESTIAIMHMPRGIIQKLLRL